MFRLVIIGVLFFSLNANSQDTLNSSRVEERSYKLFQEKSWNELIAFGNSSLEKGFDYYYLRLRMGIAYFEKGNYRLAQKHFLKAYCFNSLEDFLQEYMYYCYIYNSQYYEAVKFSKNMSSALKNRLKINKLPIIDYFVLEGGIKQPDKSDLFDVQYGQFSFGHCIGRNISFFHALSVYDQKMTSAKFNQKQYYLSVNIPISKSWKLTPAFHFINSSIAYEESVLLSPSSYINNYYVGSLLIKKSISKFDVTLGSTVANFDTTTQFQGNLSVSYYPFGNNKLFFTGLGIIQNDKKSASYKYAFSPSATCTLFRKLTLSGSYLYNEARFITEQNGYIVNNSNDLTFKRVSFMGIYAFTSRVSFYLLYQLENKSQNNYQLKTTTNYSYNNLFGGLKFIL